MPKKDKQLLPLNHLLLSRADQLLFMQWLCSEIGIKEVEKWEKKNSEFYNQEKFDTVKTNILKGRYDVDLPHWLKVTGTTGIKIKKDQVYAVAPLAYKFEEFHLQHSKNTSTDLSFEEALKKLAKGGNTDEK